MNREVQRYLESVPAERQELVSRLHALIIDLYPKAVVDMSYRMLPVTEVANVVKHAMEDPKRA